MYNTIKLLLIFCIMEEHTIIKIPMPDSIFDELDDAFVDDPKITAHDFVWLQVRALCKDAKLGKLNKTCNVNVMKDGMQAQEQIKLRGYKLPEAPSDAKWIPPNMEKDEVKYFEHKVTDKTFEYLKLYCSFAILRHTEYADSIEEDNNRKIAELEAKKDKNVAEIKENYGKAIVKFREAAPKCFEEILFNSVYPHIHKKVTENIEVEFDKENEEMYPKEKAAKTA